jgi:hypothetical protein
MKKKHFKKIEKQMLQVGNNLNKIESLSRILLHCINLDNNLKSWDIENLSLILSEKLITTKQRFNNIEEIMNI